MSEKKVEFDPIENLIGETSTPIARDLKLNLRRILEDGALSPKQGLLTLLALSCSLEYRELAKEVHRQLVDFGIEQASITEAAESASLMAMLNVYYRFKHMVHQDEKYPSAHLRMTALSKPTLGKTQFEMLAFAVSCINGCETCIVSHERVLAEAEVSAEQIHDLARLAAIVKGLKSLSFKYL